MTPAEREVEVFLSDYTGEPGERTFFLQARGPHGTSTYILEKQQIAVLAEKLREILVVLDAADMIVSTPPERDPALRLEPPIEPDWRVGTIGLSYDEADDLVVVAMQPAQEGEEETEELEPVVPEPEEFAVRYRLRRDQVRSFVLHSIAIVAEGRPICQLCGLPIDPDGHLCPASNGHRTEV